MSKQMRPSRIVTADVKAAQTEPDVSSAGQASRVTVQTPHQPPRQASFEECRAQLEGQ